MIKPAQPLFLPLAGALLVLAGCSRTSSDKDTTGTASGEVLPGSASDAMIPYDQLRSQPPFEQVTPDATSGPGAARPGDEATATPGEGDEPTAAPATPVPSASRTPGGAQ